jgi:GntR family transcriptional regulator / MocR family aminotransferase
MDFQITVRGRRDLTRQIYRQMRAAILGGRLRPGEQLPSTRSLAAQLSVARKTVTRAYELLFSESLVTGSTGSGTYVSRELVTVKKRGGMVESRLRPRKFWDGATPPAAETSQPRFDFRLGSPDVSLFPFALWRSLVASSGRILGPLDAQYINSQGDTRLRETVARYIAFTRAVVCDADQIVITHGAQQAFDLIARVLLDRGETVAVEEPGYPPVRELFASFGLKVKRVAVDGEGIRVSKLPRNTRLIYVTPSHQFPLGMPMSLERKLQLIAWAAEHRACILEDDYDSEFRFESRPLEALQNLDRSGLVVYVGTFSKVLHPGIRVGYIVAPRPLVPALVRARRLLDWHEPLVTQVALARFITEGHLARHVRRMSKVYARRRTRLLEILKQASGVFTDVIPSVAGLHVACRMKNTREVEALRRKAVARGISFNTVREFSGDESATEIAFGFGTISEKGISEGLKVLLG